MEKVSGVVEAVGDKFNGSLKVGGKWLNLKKGVKNTAKQGDMVTLSLEGWEFKGKTGTNVVAIDVVAGATEAAPTIVKAPKATVAASVGRDFNAENRGKTRCALLAGLLANPSINAADVEGNSKLINQYVSFVFGD